MILRRFVRTFLFFLSFWWIDIYELEAGRLKPVCKTLWRKGRHQYHYGKIVVDLAAFIEKPYAVIEDTINLLYKESDGPAVITALPIGVDTYLDAYKKDRQEIRDTPYYDPDLGVIHLPSLDHRIVFKLLDRELVEGWFGNARFKKLMTLLLISMLVIGGLAVGIGYVGSTKVAVRECFNPIPLGQIHPSGNSSLWSPIPCPALTQTSTRSNSTSSTSTGLYSTGGNLG